MTTAEQLDLALPSAPPACARCGALAPAPKTGERICWHCYAPLCAPCYVSPGHCGDEQAELAQEYAALEAGGRIPRRTRVQLLWMTVEQLRAAVLLGHQTKGRR